MTRIAQLSDIHFGSEADGSADVLIEELNRERLDLVILSGDLTMAARRSEFERAREFIDALEAPTLSVPGNHDITPYQIVERFIAPYKRWRAHIGDELEPTWSNEDVAVVGINTARRMRLRLDWSHGSISPRQIKALPDRFAALPKTPFRIIVAHHPFLEEDTPDLGERPRVMVKRAKKALAVFAEERVDLVLAGHLHRTYSAAYENPADAPVQGTVRAESDGKVHKVVTIQAGTALSARTRGEENSFNRIEIDDGILRVLSVTLGPDGWRHSTEALAECGPLGGCAPA